MHTFGTAINDEFGDVLETGIMVALDSVYPEKIARYITTYEQWLKER